MLVLRGHNASVRCIAYSPDGERLASCSADGVLKVWNLLIQEEERSETLKTGLEVVAWAPDGKTLAVAGEGGFVRFCNLKDGRACTPIKAHLGDIRALAYSADGRLLVTGSWDRSARRWHPTTHQETAALANSGGPITTLAVVPGTRAADPGDSADRQQVALGCSDGRLLLWEQAGPGFRELLAAGPAIHALACSPDGALLAIGYANGVIQLRDLKQNKRVTDLPGHTWTIYGLAFSPGGRQLLSGGADGKIRLWDVASRRERHQFAWHSKWVTSVAFSPDGTTAASASEDGTIVVWDIDDA